MTAVFGGTFDPPTLGHLGIITKLADNPAIQRVVVHPSYRHRFGKEALASFQDRVWMTQLMCQGLAKVEVDNAERLLVEEDEDVGARGIGSTWNYLQALERRLSLDPQDITVVLGEDCLHDLYKYYNYPALKERYTFLIVRRGHGAVIESLPMLKDLSRAEMIELDIQDTSSSIVRNLLATELIRQRKPAIIDPTVLDFIYAHNLYGTYGRRHADHE